MNDVMDISTTYWDLSFNGESIPFDRKQMILSIELTETVKGADSVTIKIDDPNMEFIQDDIYLKDVPMSLDIMFRGSAEKHCFYGYISEINPVFPDDGNPYIELYCLDKTHLMQRVKNTQTWNKVRSIDVIKEKCNGYGWKLVYPEDYEYIQQDSITQSGQTDIEFMEGLANDERELFVAKLIGDTFFYVRLGLLAEPSSNLYYRVDALKNNVLKFSPSIDKETRKIDTRYADINPSTQDTDSFFANEKTVALQTQGYPVQVSSVGYGSVPYDDTEAQKNKKDNTDTDKTERTYREQEYNTLRGDCDVLPTPELLALTYMQTINFSGLGKYLSGLYYVEGIKLTIDSSNGLSETLTLIKTGFGKTMKPAELSDEVSSNSSTDYSKGDTIRFISDTATYAHASEGVKVPNWVRAETWKVGSVDTDGKCLLLTDIESWVHMNEVEKV